jgi:predicted secreted protein
MTLFEGTVAFIVIWWLVLFMVLPWGVHIPDATEVEKGHATSAPTRPKLWKKVLVTTGIALVLWGVAFWVASSGLISFREG